MAKFGAKSEPEGKDNRRRRDSAKRRSVLIGLAVASLIAGLAGLLTALFYYGGSQRNARQQAVISPPMANTQHPVPVVRSNSKNGTAIGKSARPSGPAVLSKAWIKSVRLPRGTFLAYVPFSQPPLKAVRMARHYRISKAYLPWPGNPWAAPPSVARSLRGVALAKMPFRRDMSGYAAMLAKPPSASMVMTLDAPYYLPHHAYLPWSTVSAVHLPVPARFITAMCRGRHGAIWIATEDHGVFRYTPAAPKGKQVTQFTKQNTKGQLANNNTYALACDNRGRIWAGTLNHGVSVYNGQRWQDYDIVQNPNHKVLAGPLGNHVFALKFDPYTDQMWMCTDAGISIYQCSSHASASPGQLAGIIPAARGVVVFGPGTWHYITQANGLPPNPDCIAFAPGGTVYVGTQCAGTAIATINERQSVSGTSNFDTGHGVHATRDNSSRSLLALTSYRWHVIRGPWKMPLTATGSGLPSNLINCLVVAPSGNVIAGTDGGIAISTIDDQRSTINHAIVGDSGDNPFHGTEPDVHFWQNWTFERGRNFPAKVLGLWHPPVHWTCPPSRVLATLPAEDYTTALAWSEPQATTNEQPHRHINGAPRKRSKVPLLTANSFNLWIGHWQRGIDVWQYNGRGKVTNRIEIDSTVIGRYITSLLPLPGGSVAVGTYGHGISIITLPGSGDAWKEIADDIASTPHSSIAADSVDGNPIHAGTPIVTHEPRSAAPPNQGQLAAVTVQLAKEFRNRTARSATIMPIMDDWRTQGSWLGRYGRFWACLFACSSPFNYVWAPGSISLYHDEGIGPHHMKADTLRYWMQSRATSAPISLELPAIYLNQCIADHTATRSLDRREASIDDHGEVYPAAWQGPDLYVYLRIPAGEFALSIYFDNERGHAGETLPRDYRDYVVSPIRLPASYHFGSAIRPNTAQLAEMTPAARSRVVNFYFGVWKRFLVRGPMKLAIRVARNYSGNTILEAAMLDSLNEHPAPYYYGRTAWQAHQKQRRAFRIRLAAALQNGNSLWNQHPADDPTISTELVRSRDILQILDLLEHRDPAAWATDRQLPYSLILRWCVAQFGVIPKNSQAAEVAEKCYYELDLFHRWEAVERSRGMLTSRQIEKGLSRIVAPLRIYQPEGPNAYRDLEAEQIRWYLRHFIQNKQRLKGVTSSAANKGNHRMSGASPVSQTKMTGAGTELRQPKQKGAA